MLFRRGNFIAVRHENGWWLAQLYTNVYEDSKKARIRWFDKIPVKGPNSVFTLHECNDIPPLSIICTVKVKRLQNHPLKVSVSENDCKLVEKFLLESKTSPKKVSRSSKSKQVTRKPQSFRKGSKKQGNKTATLGKAAVKRRATGALSTPKKKTKKVTCYSNITLYKNNPLWDPKVIIPDVAPTVNSLMFTKAVKNKQYKEVERLAKNKTLFAYLFSSLKDSTSSNQSVIKRSLQYAIDNEDRKMITLLKKLSDDEMATDKKSTRVRNTQSLMEVVNTGTYNPASLGVEYVRPITMARGSREGSNAFSESFQFCSNQIRNYSAEILTYAIEQGHTYEFLQFLVLTLCPGDDMVSHHETALRANNREVATKIVKESLDCNDTDNFNQLHFEVLSLNKGEKLSPFKPVSCHKKTGYQYGCTTPLHAAALNPNSDYLKQMLRVDPQPEIKDGTGMTLLHYAAIASTDACTRFLLSQDVNPLNTSPTGITPLMWAAKTGSVPNIKALLGHAYAKHFGTRTAGPIDTSRIVDIDLIKSVTKDAGKVSSRSENDEEEEEEEEGIAVQRVKKIGLGGMELAVTKGPHSSYTALNYAVEHGHYDAVLVLLDLGANPNKPLGANKRKMFPIHIAAKYGFLEILKCLILHGAKTRSKDRHGLTAFHYAAKYNQLHCLSWLAANVVPDANIGDSSGNTPLQYASAEGFILVVKYLVEQLHVDVKETNSWGMSALEIAFLRQQMGVVEYLLNTKDVDLNFRSSSGATLVMKLCAQDMREGSTSMDALEFLLSRKDVDVLAVDNNGCNALHYLAMQQNAQADRIEGILKRLLDMGLDINSKATNGKTPLHIAVVNRQSRNNTHLVKALLKYGSEIENVYLKSNRNILQHYAESPCESAFGIFEVVEETAAPELLKKLVEHRDHNGMNILHIVMEKAVKKSNKTGKQFAWKMVEKLLGSVYKMDINCEITKKKIGMSAKCKCSFKGEFHARFCPLHPYTDYGGFRPLTFAIKFGTKEEVEEILAHEPNVNFQDLDGMYPLHHAVSSKSALIPLLLKHGAITDVLPGKGICRDNKLADIPILVLAATFCLDYVLELEAAGACTHATDPDGKNALHHIVGKYTRLDKRIEIAEKLLPMVDDVNEVDEDGNSYLHHAVCGVEHGSNVSIEMISTLLLMGADPNLKNKRGQTPLHFAFQPGKDSRTLDFSDPIEVVSILTHLMTKDAIKAADLYHGFTPLHLSSMRGGSVTSMHLLQHGCDLEGLDNQGNTPLTLAVYGKHQSCVLMLVEKGANIDRPVNFPIFRIEPLASIKTKKKVEEVRYTWLPVEERGMVCPPTNPSTSNSNLILYQVIRHGWQGVLFKLVDLLGHSFVPLEAAIVTTKFNLAVTLLLKFGKTANCADVNEKGQTLVHCLAFTPSTELELQRRLLNLLIKFNFNLSIQDTAYKCTPLHYACYQKKCDLSKLLITEQSVNCLDKFNRTPLGALFWKGNPEKHFIECLVQAGASLEELVDFNLQESNYPLFDYKFPLRESDYFTQYSHSYTVLIKTIIEDDMTCFSTLLDLGAQVTTPCSAGISPLMYAAKLNRVAMFKQLLTKGGSAALSAACNDGKTALQYAVDYLPGAELENSIIVASIKEAVTDGTEQGNMDSVLNSASYTEPLSNNHEDQEMGDIPDYTTDCEKYFADLEEKREKKELKALPDSCVSLDESECEVYKDENGVYYDMLMTKIDIKRQAFGLYNFYRLQILRNIGKDIYLLINKWGRIGDEGQHQETPFPTLEECKAEFRKIFKAKTKNEWADIDNFVNHPGKYRLVNWEWRYHDQYNKIEYDFRVDEEPDNMDSCLFNVLTEASDPKSMREMLADDLKLDVAQLPFGFIKLDAIEKANPILDEIQKIVKETKKINFSQQQNLFFEKTQKKYDLTNELYQLVPLKGFSVTQVHPLRTDDDIKEWRTRLVNLRDMEVVSRMMAASQLNKSVIHPIQYLYKCLGCDVTTLAPEDMVTQYLLRCVYAAQGHCRGVKGVYKIQSHAPDKRKQGKKRLLFHGISTGALLSILKRGLLNAPFGRDFGERFGNGIYLADSFKKSLSYARGSKSKFVLVCSVRMGNTKNFIPQSNWEHPVEEEMKKFDTVWAVGKLHQNPAHNIKLPCGNVLSLGKFQEVGPETFTKKNDDTEYTMEKLVWRNKEDGDDDDHQLDVEDDDSEYSEENEEREESEDSEDSDDDSNKSDERSEAITSDGKDEKFVMTQWRYDNLTMDNEFVVKRAENIRLEYIIQMGR